jgi:hypothetical protein
LIGEIIDRVGILGARISCIGGIDYGARLENPKLISDLVEVLSQVIGLVVR